MSDKEKSANENKDTGYGTVRPMNKVSRELAVELENKEKRKSEK